ncbi:MAG: thioesterase domain-containing protein, partial [Burkholderiaceae bacterium]
SLPQQIRQVAPNARIISLGGATEASIWSIYYPIDQHDSNWVSIPYGRPLANQSWHVLNDSGKDAPTWVPGHLYIGGIGLALGYWQDKEKTDAAFVTHPHTGKRLYRTGDLGRYLPDGNIEFLGRSDFQVKIQGFRVELGEIEQALVSHSDIRAATVIASATAAGKQLLAFIVLEAGTAALLAEEVQEFLRAKLPRYMVPSQITVLEQLPLTANGKVDRQALAKLGAIAQQKIHAYTPAGTETEKELVAIWEEVLAVKPVGIHDDFFDLGGQSFAAVRVITRLAKQFGRRLPLSELLEGRTIEYLARRLENVQQEGRAWSPLVPVHVNAASSERPCFFVHPAGGNVLCYRNLAQSMGRPFYGLQAAGLSGEQPPLDQIAQMATLYLQAIRQIQPTGPYLLGGWSSGGVIAFEMARQLERDGETVERVVMLDTPAPLQHEAIDDLVMLGWFLEDLNIGFDAVRTDLRALVGMEPSRQLAAALPLLKRSQSMDVELDLHQMELVYNVFRSIIHACRDYRPTPIGAPISVLRAKEGRVSEFIGHPADRKPDWGWSSFTRGQVTSAIVPGNHYTILSLEHGAVLLAELKNQLMRSREAA